MDTKKIMLFSVIGFIISLLIFGGTLYITVFKGAPKSEKDVKTYNYDVGEISTNIGDTKHYFKGSITIETTDKKLPDKMTEKSVIVRDAILQVLLSQKPENMTSDEGLGKIKKELISKISKAIDTQSIRNVYFTDYIVQ